MIKKLVKGFFIGIGMHSLLFGEDGVSQASIATGRRLFMKNCTSCHGKDGRGDTPLGRVLKTIPDFTSSVVQSKSNQELFKFITQGKPPMPSYKHLSEEERMDLVHFIRTFSREGNQ